MKNVKYLFLMLLAVLTLASCKNDETDENGNPTFKKYFRMEVTRCERVSGVLIVDFNLKNVSGKNLQEVQLNGGSVWNMSKDNLGNEYYSEVSFGGEWGTSARKSIVKDGSVSGSFRISSFDPTNSAKKLDLKFACSCADLDFNGGGNVDNVKITDNRKLLSGIDTNDFGLSYKLLGTSRKTFPDLSGTKSVIDIRFSVTNNTGKDISDYYLNLGNVNNMFKSDKESFNCDISTDGNSFDHCSFQGLLKAGQTRTFVIRVNWADTNIKRLSGMMTCKSSSYRMAATEVNFHNIDID